VAILRTLSGVIKRIGGLLVKCPICLSDCNRIWNLSTDFHRIPQYQISHQSVQWEPRRCMRTDGRGDREMDGRDDSTRATIISD
jgi:hypothetical protein